MSPQPEASIWVGDQALPWRELKLLSRAFATRRRPGSLRGGAGCCPKAPNHPVIRVLSCQAPRSSLFAVVAMLSLVLKRIRQPARFKRMINYGADKRGERLGGKVASERGLTRTRQSYGSTLRRVTQGLGFRI